MKTSDVTCSGVILAGGLSRRLSGTNKAFLEIGGTRIIDRIYAVFAPIFDEIIIVTNDPVSYLEWDAHIAADIYDVRSSLTGIYTGLFYAGHPFIFVTACDTPFLQPGMIKTILNEIEPDAGMVVPETSAGLEPLCAVYSRKCLSLLDRHIREDKLKIRMIMKKTRVKKITEETLRAADPDLLSLVNINTAGELTRARSLANGEAGDREG